MDDALLPNRKAFFLGERGKAEGPHQASILPFRCRCNHQLAVIRTAQNRAVGRDVWMLGAEALGDHAADEIVGRLIGKRGNGALQQRCGHKGAFTTALAFEQCQQNTFLELVREEDIDERHGHLGRGPSGSPFR